MDVSRIAKKVGIALVIAALLAMVGVCGRWDYEDRVAALSGEYTIQAGGE
jgi:hypothetical protein